MNAQVNRTNRSGEYPLIATEGSPLFSPFFLFFFPFSHFFFYLLLIYITGGQKGAVSVLSDHATVVDARSGDDATALVEACRRGHAEMV